jgi:uncharacterized membrane protein
MPGQPIHRPRLPVLRYLHARPRVVVAAAAGIAVGVLLPRGLSPTVRAVIGWDVAATVFLILAIVMAARATSASMRRRAALETEGRWVFLGTAAGAAFFSMFAILGVMQEAKGAGGNVPLNLLAGVTILLSWLLGHTVFALHYAHAYFNDLGENRPPGLDFPSEHDDPDYWDFLYFSFVVGMTAQVSDVQVLTRSWRRLVLAHGVLSFLFNTVVLALSINLFAAFFQDGGGR